MTNTPPASCPLRIDFAGGWLDVPRYAIPGAFVVNCAISPLVRIWESLDGSIYPKSQYLVAVADNGYFREIPQGAGIGGSAAWRILNGEDVDALEAAQGCGWQDAAVIRRTGLCCWASGPEPVLVHHDSGDWLRGKMALLWTGQSHDSASIAKFPRYLKSIENASVAAMKAVQRKSIDMLADAIDMSFNQQLAEGMQPLPVLGIAAKYCGAGWGGYAVYLFEDEGHRDAAVRSRGLMAVEPYCK